MATRKNALWNCKNPNQGKYTKVLAICSAGLLRSATIAWWLARNTEANVRNAGIHDYALVPLDDVLVTWADVIICSDEEKQEYVLSKFDIGNRKLYCFDLPDIYEYRQPELVELIGKKYLELGVINDIR